MQELVQVSFRGINRAGGAMVRADVASPKIARAQRSCANTSCALRQVGREEISCTFFADNEVRLRGDGLRALRSGKAGLVQTAMAAEAGVRYDVNSLIAQWTSVAVKVDTAENGHGVRRMLFARLLGELSSAGGGAPDRNRTCT